MAKKIYKRLDIHGAKSYSPKFENFTFPRKKISNSLVVFKNFKELQSLSIESCDWPMWLDLRWQMTNLLQWVHRITVSTVIILYVLSRWIIHILQYLTTLNFFSQLWTIVLFTWPAIRFDSSGTDGSLLVYFENNWGHYVVTGVAAKNTRTEKMDRTRNSKYNHQKYGVSIKVV